MRFTDEYDEFYERCLVELKSRNDWTEAYLPMLERYVMISMKAAKLGADIVDEEVVVKHTNRAKETNEHTSPKWRMFILLNGEANDLAKNLKLSPVSAPVKTAKQEKKKGFELGHMKKAV